MTRVNRDGSTASSTIRQTGVRRLAISAIIAFAALLIMAIAAMRPVAFAVDEQQNESSLVLGEIDGRGSATVLVYLNGSDLESEAGEATGDIAEMLESGIGENANVVIETVGTRDWKDFGIASDHTQRYIVNQGKLELVDDSLGQLDTTDPETLADFIQWGTANYPADRYILVMWDHGAGPVYGFGYDEFQSDESALTLDEMKQAFDSNPDVHFDIIGMDCCIMGSLETCLALQPYCDYMVVSEDFEPGIGWNYKGWMNLLEQDPAIDTVELGKEIVDDMVSEVAQDEENGDATLALIDESSVDELYDAWKSFAYAHEGDLLGTNYSQETEWRDRPGGDAGEAIRAHGNEQLYEESFGTSYMGDDDWEQLWEEWAYDGSYVTMTDYFVTDIMQVASSMNSDEAADLEEAFKSAMVHYRGTKGEQGMSGLAVTLPYGDAEFYDQLEKVFKSSGFDTEYVNWLEAFVNAEGATSYYESASTQGDDFGAYDSSHGQGFGNGHGPGMGDDGWYGEMYDLDYGNDYADEYEFEWGYGYEPDYFHGRDFGYWATHASAFTQ